MADSRAVPASTSRRRTDALAGSVRGRRRFGPIKSRRLLAKSTKTRGRVVLHKIAEEAEIRPYKLNGSRGDPSDVTPHALRHGVAYRMMNEEDGNTLYDVRNRLRHRSIQTTERVYDHLLKV